jgi:transposase
MTQTDDKTYSFYVGVDISKMKFDASIMDSTDKSLGHREFNNNKTGFKALLSWLKDSKCDHTLFGVEATGPYSRALLDYLYQHNCAAAQLEPKRVLHHRKAKGWEQKTDCTDSVLIADYIKSHAVKLYVPRDRDYEQLHELTNDRRILVSQKKALSLRQACQVMPGKTLKKLICVLDKSIKELDQQIRELIKGSPKMTDDMALLLSIPGVGEVTASYFLAKIVDATRFETSKAVVRYFGMNPCPQKSGTCKTYNGSISKMGDPDMRALLYNGAGTVVQFVNADSPVIGSTMREFVKELQHPDLSKNPNKAPKAKKAIRCAIMRKQLVLMWSVLISRQPYDPNFATKPAQTAIEQQAESANQATPSDATGHVQDRAEAAPATAGEGNDAGLDGGVQGLGCVGGDSRSESILAIPGRTAAHKRQARVKQRKPVVAR